jgi:hypothetical protein
MPQLMMTRIVWRVAQGQCDLLGLLSIYLINLKLLMRTCLWRMARQLPGNMQFLTASKRILW